MPNPAANYVIYQKPVVGMNDMKQTEVLIVEIEDLRDQLASCLEEPSPCPETVGEICSLLGEKMERVCSASDMS